MTNIDKNELLQHITNMNKIRRDMDAIISSIRDKMILLESINEEFREHITSTHDIVNKTIAAAEVKEFIAIPDMEARSK